MRTVPLPGKKKPRSNPFKCGKAYLVRTVTNYFVAELVHVTMQELLFKNASWVPAVGRYSDWLKTGTFNEVEPLSGPLIIGRGAIVDCVEWRHRVPKKV